jgi:hypothetical protein
MWFSMNTFGHMCGTIELGSCIRWVLSFGIKTGYDRWPASQPTHFWVGSDENFLDTCLHKNGKVVAVVKVGGDWTHWLADQVARPAGHHLAGYHLGQVGGGPPWPYKYPPTSESRHTPHFRDSTCKALFFSVVARRSLIGRVVRLWGPEGLSACWEPSS